MTKKTFSKKQLTVYGGIYSALLVGVYSWVYLFEPFSDYVNLLLLNGITILAALVCAVIISLVVRYFERGEPPRRVWEFFAIALWMWAVAELAWAVYNMLWGEVPTFTVADILWVGAYVFFTVALSSQFRLIFFDRSRRPIWIGLAVWLAVILLSMGITLWNGDTWQDVFVYFYPVADFAVGVAALILAISFRRGALARPWLSLFGFVVSDSLYIWATTTGVYDWVTRNGPISFLVDIIYLLAYLFLAWGVFNQYITLQFGAPATEVRPTVPAKPQSIF
jgi:hypothetical protein